jgi:hypothetical protein
MDTLYLDIHTSECEEDDPARRVFMTVSTLLEPKVIMDIKDKEEPVIEFLLSEECAG